MSRKVFEERIDFSKLTPNQKTNVEKRIVLYAASKKKGNDNIARGLLLDTIDNVSRVNANAIKPFARGRKVRSGLTAIQKAGQDLRLDKSSTAGRKLAKANTKATRDLNKRIALQRLKEKGFSGMCGFGSNQVML